MQRNLDDIKLVLNILTKKIPMRIGVPNHASYLILMKENPDWDIQYTMRHLDPESTASNFLNNTLDTMKMVQREMKNNCILENAERDEEKFGYLANLNALLANTTLYLYLKDIKNYKIKQNETVEDWSNDDLLWSEIKSESQEYRQFMIETSEKMLKSPFFQDLPITVTAQILHTFINFKVIPLLKEDKIKDDCSIVWKDGEAKISSRSLNALEDLIMNMPHKNEQTNQLLKDFYGQILINTIEESKILENESLDSIISSHVKNSILSLSNDKEIWDYYIKKFKNDNQINSQIEKIIKNAQSETNNDVVMAKYAKNDIRKIFGGDLWKEYDFTDFIKVSNNTLILDMDEVRKTNINPEIFTTLVTDLSRARFFDKGLEVQMLNSKGEYVEGDKCFVDTIFINLPEAKNEAEKELHHNIFYNLIKKIENIYKEKIEIKASYHTLRDKSSQGILDNLFDTSTKIKKSELSLSNEEITSLIDDLNKLQKPNMEDIVIKRLSK